MIRPATGVAFTWSDDGDVRGDHNRRRAVGEELGVGSEWATVEQVHGADAVPVSRPGPAGRADALVTTSHGLPVAVFTADCLGVVLRGEGGVGVAHAGWRGLVAGVLESAVSGLDEAGTPPLTAHIGPGIGPCCFEVGPEVAELFGEHTSLTSWGTTSVDLASAAARRLDGLDVWVDDRCTRCGGGFSHRRDSTPHRMAALGWVE